MTSAAEIARGLGGRASADGFLCRCPVPSHGQGRGDRSPSLLVKDGTDAVLLKCFAGCDVKDILAELRKRGAVGPADEERDRDRREVVERPPEHNPDPKALELWNGGRPIAGGGEQARFLAARGLTIAPPVSLRATTILHLDRYPLPAMLAAVQAPDRRVIALQQTLIDPRGDRKAQVRIPRQTVGALGWGAVRLAGAGAVLGLAEGTEKALAAMQLFAVPCWSSLGAARMHRVWVPDHVQEVHVFLDNDDAGRAAAERTAHAHRHRKVVLRFPPEQFKDWDDVTRARAIERSAAA
jgi:putative DNA primase/helicase